MAGGSGTRFWPKSSTRNPKQLLALTGKRTQIQLTWDRLNTVVPTKNRWVICTKALAKATRKQLPKVHLLEESQGRNTMAAVCWSAWAAQLKEPGALVAVLPADAHVTDIPAFKTCLQGAYDLAERERKIVCLGIKPAFAATGYGYIHAGNPVGNGYEIKRFIEKPDAQRAQELYHSGHYYWNAGIFVFPTDVLINEVRAHAPDFASFFDRFLGKPQAKHNGAFNKSYATLPSISVDVALMEKTTQGALIPGDFGWNDLGSWTALPEVLPANSQAGLINARAGHMEIESEGIIADVTDRKFLGLIGVKDLIVVETENALLICHKDKAQKIKDLVGTIAKNKKLKKELL